VNLEEACMKSRKILKVSYGDELVKNVSFWKSKDLKDSKEDVDSGAYVDDTCFL
jgi:hypothetical protein